MTGPIVRILLRVLSGALLARGMPADWADYIATSPEVFEIGQQIAGLAVWGATELYYKIAKARGWAT